MARRAERPVWQDKDRRRVDRRQSSRRKSEQILVWLKYLGIVILTALILEAIRR